MATSPLACVPNLGPRAQRKRLVFGIAALGASVVIAPILVLAHVPLAWRLLLFVPFYLGALGVFQARDKT